LDNSISVIITNVSVGIAFLAMILLFIRLIVGPTVIDRGIALDTLTIISVALIAYIAVFTGRVIYLDVAMVYALLSFLGVVALARYLERGM